MSYPYSDYIFFGKSDISWFVRDRRTDLNWVVDLPAIGLQTIESLKKHGIGGIAVEAGGILLIEREEGIATADGAGIFIIGVRG